MMRKYLYIKSPFIHAKYCFFFTFLPFSHSKSIGYSWSTPHATNRFCVYLIPHDVAIFVRRIAVPYLKSTGQVPAPNIQTSYDDIQVIIYMLLLFFLNILQNIYQNIINRVKFIQNLYVNVFISIMLTNIRIGLLFQIIN